MRWPSMRLDLVEYAYWLGPPVLFAVLWQGWIEISVFFDGTERDIGF